MTNAMSLKHVEHSSRISALKLISITWYMRWKDADSQPGKYYRLNHTLERYVPNPQCIMEKECELVTCFRTGLHSMAELGRYSN